MAGKDVFRNALLFAVEHARPIAVALILAGYIGALVMPVLNKGTFFDENALMVHNSIPSIGCAHDHEWLIRLTFAVLRVSVLNRFVHAPTQ